VSTSASPSPARSIVTEDELLHRFHRDGDYAARAEVIGRLMPMVHHVARRYASRGENYDDLVQAGAIGLVKAVDRFDVDRGVVFSTFAIPNITGEIRRHFRDHGWSMRVPRDLKELDAKLGKVRETLTRELQRVPTVAELAKAADVSVDQALEAMAAGRQYSAVSLDAPIDEERTEMDSVGSIDAQYEIAEQRLTIVEGLGALRERERKIVLLRFHDGLTQTEIAERMGISQMHVSRLLTQSLAAMRQHLETVGQAPAPRLGAVA
jgi:RNA polymerase sigma-B factor